MIAVASSQDNSGPLVGSFRSRNSVSDNSWTLKVPEGQPILASQISKAIMSLHEWVGIRRSLSDSAETSLVTLTRTQYLSRARNPSGAVGVDRAEAGFGFLVGVSDLLPQPEASPTNASSKDPRGSDAPAPSASASMSSFFVAISVERRLFRLVELR